jgi:molecular chaperone HtpG
LKDNSASAEDVEKNKTLQDELEATFKGALNSEKLKLKLENLKTDSVSAIMLLSEQSRRMQEMFKMYGNMGIAMPMEEEQTLVLNKNNKLVQLLINIKGEESKQEDAKLICEQIYDLALLGNRPLETNEMIKFIERSNKVLEKLAQI